MLQKPIFGDPSIQTGNPAEIILTKNKISVIDSKWFDYLNQWNWCFGEGYAVRGYWCNGHINLLYMHCVITDFSEEVDHIDRNMLNNTEKNLRPSGRVGNAINRGLFRNNKTGYRGVMVGHPRLDNKIVYNAFIRHSGKQFHLGTFDSAVEAALARDKVAIEVHGEFAVLNFPLELSHD